MRAAAVLVLVLLASCGGKPEGRTFPHQCFTDECIRAAPPPPCTADNDLAPHCKGST